MGLAALEATISLVSTMECGVRHFLPHVILDCVSFFAYLEVQHL